MLLRVHCPTQIVPRMVANKDQELRSSVNLKLKCPALNNCKKSKSEG